MYAQMLEKLARHMCQRDGLDPDTLVTRMTPYIGRAGVQVMLGSSYFYPAWRMFEESAAAALDVLRGVSVPLDVLNWPVVEEQPGEKPEMTDEQAQEYARQEEIYEADDTDKRDSWNKRESWKNRMGLR